MSKTVNGVNMQEVYLADPDLITGSKSLTLTLSSGVGSVPIPDTSHIVGVKPSSSATAVRVGLEAPEADGTATGLTTVAADLKKGIPVDNDQWTYFNVGQGVVTRVLYVKGGTTDTVQVVVM